MTDASSERDDLVEPEGVNAGASLAERDRLPDGEPAATDGPALPPEPTPTTPDEMVGAPGQADGTPGQQMEAGEG